MRRRVMVLWDSADGTDEPMSPESFKSEMETIRMYRDDVEYVHCQADELMKEVLKSLGYGEGVEIFDDMEKWYASP